jgi:hypothetical protein
MVSVTNFSENYQSLLVGTVYRDIIYHTRDIACINFILFLLKVIL